ncbi:hypothetical protein VM98_38120, partial [Streptomyces rubellomurinus subsp. indigoferus]
MLAAAPTGAVDSATGEALVAVLLSRWEAGAAAVMVTHEAADASGAARVVHLRHGAVASVSRGQRGAACPAAVHRPGPAAAESGFSAGSGFPVGSESG